MQNNSCVGFKLFSLFCWDEELLAVKGREDIWAKLSRLKGRETKSKQLGWLAVHNKQGTWDLVGAAHVQSVNRVAVALGGNPGPLSIIYIVVKYNQGAHGSRVVVPCMWNTKWPPCAFLSFFTSLLFLADNIHPGIGIDGWCRRRQSTQVVVFLLSTICFDIYL